MQRQAQLAISAWGQPSPQILPTLVALQPVEPGGHGQWHRQHVFHALGPEQERTHHHQRGNQRRRRIARHADPGFAGQLAKGQWLTRLNGQPPEIQAAEFLDGLLEMVFLTDRDATGTQQQVALRGRQAQGMPTGRQLIGHDAIVVHLDAPAAQ
ncbi:hypothetical protein D3C86_1828490 [compost metagenome]